MKGLSVTNEECCKANVDQMLQRSQTKAISPLITLGLLTEHCETGQTIFTDQEIMLCYHRAVNQMQERLGYNLHIGGRYEDAYSSRLSKYGVLASLSGRRYKLQEAYADSAEALRAWIPERISHHVVERLGLIPLLGDIEFRMKLASDMAEYASAISRQIDMNPTNFEIVSFAVIKVHLEKFACKIYRDTRTSAHDSGVDLSTNFGVVYQIKKLKVYNKTQADSIYAELKMNFDNERITDGNVIIIIDDISKEIKNYLIDMNVQSISKPDVLKLATQFEDMEDRAKVLRIVLRSSTGNTQVPPASSGVSEGRRRERQGPVLALVPADASNAHPRHRVRRAQDPLHSRRRPGGPARERPPA